AELKLVGQGDDEAGSGGAERVTERNGPAVDVDPIGIEIELLNARHGLRGEGFVELTHVHVIGGEAGAGKGALRGRHRTEAHGVWLDASDRGGDIARERHEVVLL